MDGLNDWMKEGERGDEKCSCVVKICKALPLKLRGATREIVSLRTLGPEQQKGLATRLLGEVCREADRHKITLILFPKPFGNRKMTQEQLIKWYAERFGFEVIQVKPAVMMARMPYAVGKVQKSDIAAAAAITIAGN